jgi:threonine dehydrogenase-like Zn-dependent dehydrogenase
MIGAANTAERGIPRQVQRRSQMGKRGIATAVVYTGPESLEVQQFPIPHVAPDEMLVEVELCGVDGSEVHIYKGEMALYNRLAPVVLGDEVVGRVCAIGAVAQMERGLDVGDRVTIEARWPCSEGCRNCDRGQYFLCKKNPKARGYSTIPTTEAPGLWGSYASHLFVPAGALSYKVPDELPLKAALFACSVLANGMRWVELSQAGPGRTVVVIGPGPQGIACVLAAAHAGARVVSVGLERDVERLALATFAGAEATVAIADGETLETTVNRIQEILGDVDVVIDAAGFASAKSLAYAAIGQLGVLVNVAVATPQVQEVDYQDLLMKELTILNPISHPHAVQRSLDLAVSLLHSGIDVGSLVTHEFPLAEAEHAIAVAAYKTEESPIKVVLNPRA